MAETLAELLKQQDALNEKIEQAKDRERASELKGLADMVSRLHMLDMLSPKIAEAFSNARGQFNPYNALGISKAGEKRGRKPKTG